MVVRNIGILAGVVSLLILIALHPFGVSAEKKPAETMPAEPRVADNILCLDFAASRSVSKIPLVGGAAWVDGDWLYLKDQVVEIRFPGGRSYEGRVYLIQFERDADQLVSISLSSYPMAIDDAYASAMSLARDWKLPTEKLKQWKAIADAGQWHGTTVELIDNHQVPAVDVCIDHSFELNKLTPTRVVFQLGWIRGATTTRGSQR
jgi:hypothetical protein